ncbi:S1 RNA-binding domain-containing protein [Microbulbifer sp. NBRC 101763]|uniref:S1 RNA-binding domain-containing protein n=1 Tax=Microbulbifer sp. NBRC 101763 TaxID=1113820 RepID=UPI003341C2B9
MDFKIGDIIRVKVENVNDSGLEVVKDGCKGVVRIIDLDWDTYGILEKMYDDYSCSDEVDVKVVAIADNRFRGSVKDIYPEKIPWSNPSIYRAGEAFNGIVSREAEFGYFIKLSTGAVSLLMKKESEDSKLKVGASIEVIIESVDPSLEKLIVSAK